MSINQVSVCSLAPEIHCQILGGLENLQDFEASSSVCKLWHDIIRSPRFQVIIQQLKINEIPVKYSAKMQELVNYISILPSNVADIVDIGDLDSWSNYATDTNDYTLLMEYGLKLNEFYQVFKKRAVIILHNNIDSHEFMISARAVLPELEGEKRLSSGLLIKIENGYRNFYRIAFKDVIQACASKFKMGVTQNLFNQKIKFLKMYCEPFLHFDDKISSALKAFISKNRNEYRVQLKSTIEELEKEQDFIKVRVKEVEGEIKAALKGGDSNKYKELVSELQGLLIDKNKTANRLFMLSQRINELKSEYDAIANDEFLSY